MPDQIGPLQLVVVGFVEPELDGSILAALADATASGAIRVVDALGVNKSADGIVEVIEVSGLSEEEAVEYGAWVGALIGLGAGGIEGAEIGALVGGMAAADEYEYGMDEAALATIAEDLPPGGAGLLLVLEHRWAIPVREAMVAKGGILIAQDFLNPEALFAIGEKLAE